MCRPLYLWFRFLFADNFKYNLPKMRTRAIILFIMIFQILIIELIFFKVVTPDHRSSVRFIIYPTFFLWLISFYRASYAQPTPIPRYSIQQVPQGQWCNICNNWQPERADHCIMCNKCVLKYDNYMFLIANWVGYHNEKLFFLYSVYGFILNIIYIEFSSRFSFGQHEEITVFFVVVIGYWILNVIIYFLTLMYFGISMNFFIAFWNNITLMGKFSNFINYIKYCEEF